MKNFFPAILLLSVFAFSSCDEGDQSSAGEVDLSLSLFSNAAVQGKVTIDEATLRLSEIDFIATNKDLAQVSFSQTVSPDQAINLNNPSRDKQFPDIAITSGTYEPVRIELSMAQPNHTLKSITNPQTGVSEPDLADFFQNARPGLMIEGNFFNQGQATRFLLAITDLTSLSTQATQVQSPRINVETRNIAEVTFDVANWMQEITTQRLESAQVVNFQNEQIIFVHPEFNTSIYRLIISRMQQAGTGVALEMTAISQD